MEEHGADHHLFSLLSGRVVGLYRSLAEHWYLCLPNGEWDGSRDCLNYLLPPPTKTPPRTYWASNAKPIDGFYPRLNIFHHLLTRGK